MRKNQTILNSEKDLNIRSGVILNIYGPINRATVQIDNGPILNKIQFFYHCSPNDIENGNLAFHVDDKVLIAKEDDVDFIIGFEDLRPRACQKTYVYVTISDYVTIWDLETGEVAENICNNEGKIYDDNGNPLVIFPCHKNELVTWLEKYENKPTRQVLKDEPINNRDYLNDNELDIGNENRVELANTFDPSYELYYGVPNNTTYINTVRDEFIDEKNPYCCFTSGCVVDPLDYFLIGTVKETNTPNPVTLVDCLPEECADSFSCNRDFEHGKDCFMKTFYSPYRRCRNCGHFIDLGTGVEHVQKYFPKTKHLYLGPYPSPTYLRPGGFGLPSGLIEYSIEDVSAYNEAIDIECDNTKFGTSHWLSTPDWEAKKEIKQGDVVSINTKLGNLMIDYIPYKEWEESTERIYERMRDVTEDDFLSTYLMDGVCNTVSEWESCTALWPALSEQYAEHATEELNWCRTEARRAVDIHESESNRTGITWCGSPTPRDELNEIGEVVKEAVTENWYRVILNFYTGGFHTDGKEAMQNWYGSSSYCPNEEMCADLLEQYGDAGAVCVVESYTNKLFERFSSVQATIELEKPERYSKKRSATFLHCTTPEEGSVVCTTHYKYKRPDGYTGHEEEFTSLCAFPGRTQGYDEDEENDKCFPFDGTYNILTLGEAVEKLINNHYEDGSDDQLLVYLLKD